MTTATRLAFLLAMLAAFVGSSLVAHGQEPEPGNTHHPIPNGIVQPGGDQRGTCDQGAWSFNGACCCTAGWCHRIPCARVRHDGRSYRLELHPGDHPNMKRGARQWTVPEHGVDLSSDPFCYACTGGHTLRCLLVQGAGS